MCQKINHLAFIGTTISAIELAVDELDTRGLTPGRNQFFDNVHLLDVWKNVRTCRSQLSKSHFNIIRSEIYRLSEDVGRRFDNRVLE